MMVLTLKTDQENAEVTVFDGDIKKATKSWLAHRELAETIHQVIDEVCEKAGASIQDIRGIVCYEGPGSFTGLRIGLTVGNALAYAMNIPIVKVGKDNWQKTGLKRLASGENDSIVLPEYGGEANVTIQKK